MIVGNTDIGTVDWNLQARNTANLVKTVPDFLNNAIKTSNVLVGVAGTVGIAGFVFDIAQDENIDLVSSITDHYIETGSPVQDHIAFRPERVSVRGFVGEYKDIITGKKSKLEKITQKLTTLASYLPPLSKAASSVYENLNTINKDNAIKNLVNVGEDLFSAYRDINIPQNEQQKAFIYFEALRNAKVTFTIQTPFRYYTDMAIESMRVTQSANTKDQSDFSITFKKIRYVDTEIKRIDQNASSQVENGETQGRLQQQSKSTTNKGTVAKTETRLTKAIDSALSGRPMDEVMSLKQQIEKLTKLPTIKGF